MNPIQFNNSTQSTEFVKSSTHESSTSNKFKAIALGLLALSGGAAATKTDNACALTYPIKHCYDTWPKIYLLPSTIPFNNDYDAIHEIKFQKCIIPAYEDHKRGNEVDASRVYRWCTEDKIDLYKNLQQIFNDVTAQEKIYQSATQKLTSECEFWKNIFTILDDKTNKLFSLDTQESVNWKLSLFPEANNINEKVQVFRNKVPDCLNSNYVPFGYHSECADLSFAKTYETELHSLNPSTLKETVVKETTDQSQFLNIRSLKGTVAKIKESVASNEPNLHETAIQSITRSIENTKKAIVDSIKNVCHYIASQNNLKFGVKEKGCVVADHNDKVIYKLEIEA